MSISILIAGDIVPYERTEKFFRQKNSTGLFEKEVNSLISNSDFSIINFETPIILENSETPIKKSGPNFHSFPEALDTLKDVGVNMITLANNHFRDQGQNGVENTLDYADTIGIKYVGGGKNINQARQISFQRIKEKTFSFINVCEQEWSIADKEYGGSNPYDIINIHHDIVEGKQKADYVILIIHGGIEHYQLPSPRMKKEYRYFVELGADAVVNHHQHCFSGYEIYQGKPIFYGLGNFCFDRKAYKKNGMWDEGLVLNLFFDDDYVKFEIFPIQQCGDTPNVRMLEKNAFKNRLQELNDIIQDDNKLEAEYVKWVLSKSKQRISQLNAFGNKYFDKIYKRGWLGRLYSNKRIYIIKDLLHCESHIDSIKYMLKELVRS